MAPSGSVSIRPLHEVALKSSGRWAQRGFDDVVIADALYDEDAHEALLSTLCAVLRPGMRCYSAFVDRPYSLQFMTMLHGMGLFRGTSSLSCKRAARVA